MSEDREREFLDAVQRRTGLSHREILEAIRKQRESDDRQAAAEADPRALYSAFVELRDRLRAASVCLACGSVTPGRSCQCENDE